MAEVVGLVASSLTLADVVGKVGSGIFKLKRMYDEVQDVPSTIQSLLRRLDITFMLVEQVVHDMSCSDTGLQDDTAVKRCILYCESAFNEIMVSVDNLLVSIDCTKQFKRKRGRVKVVLHRDLLSRHERHLGEIIQLLTLAEAASSRAQIRRLPAVLLQQMLDSAVSAVQQQMGSIDGAGESKPKSAEVDAPHLKPVSAAVVSSDTSIMMPWRGPAFFGRITTASHTSLIKNGSLEWEVTDRRFRLQFPWWLTQRAWEVRLCAGWQYTFRTYNAVSSISPVMNCAREGDVEGLLELFREGKASPFDTNEFGWTPLHYSLLYSRTAMAKLLLQAGCHMSPGVVLAALTGYTDVDSQPRLSKSTQNWINFEEYDALMTSQGLWNLCEDLPLSSMVTHLVNPFISGAELEILLPRISPKHYSLPIADRLRILGYAMPWVLKPDSFCHMLWPGGVVSAEDVLELQSQRCSILHQIAFFSAQDGFRSCPDIHIHEYNPGTDIGKVFRRTIHAEGGFRDHQAWKTLRLKVISITADLHFRQDEAIPYPVNVEGPTKKPIGTPLSAILSAWRDLRFWIRRRDWITQKQKEYMLNMVLREWLDDLCHGSVDLRSYGQKELDILKSIVRQDYPRYSGFGHDAPRNDFFKTKHADAARFPRLQAFEFGPLPSDWTWYWDWEVEDFAGEFWMTVENPPLCIPGSWVEDDQGWWYDTSDDET